METDVSNSVTTSVLTQKNKEGQWYLVAYFSKVINSAEVNYEIYNKEMLVLMRRLEE
jgi:hypothetical protein